MTRCRSGDAVAEIEHSQRVNAILKCKKEKFEEKKKMIEHENYFYSQ